MMGILKTILLEFAIRKVRDAADRDIAFEIFKGQKPDIIFLDWVSGHDEVKFLNKVRTSKDSHNLYVPIIVVTSYSEQTNVIAARDLGVTEFLAAPVSAKSIRIGVATKMSISRRRSTAASLPVNVSKDAESTAAPQEDELGDD